METIVPIDIAKELKDKGFDKVCDYTYCKIYDVKDDILELYPDLTDDGYSDLLKDNGGTFEEWEVFELQEKHFKTSSKNSLIEMTFYAICSAPRIFEVFDWFRINKKIHISIIYISENKYRWRIETLNKKLFAVAFEEFAFEKCCLSAIDKVLKSFL